MNDLQPTAGSAAAGEAEDNYRAVSISAIVALVLGLISPLAVFHVVLVIIPLAAMGAGWFALRRIADHPTPLSGRALAVSGLTLAVLACGWSTASHLGHRYLVLQQARQVAQQWLQLVRDGKHYQAHQLMMDPRQRMPVDSALIKQYQDDATLRDKFREIFQGTPLREIYQQREQAAPEYQSSLGQHTFVDVSGLEVDDVRLLYRLVYREAGQVRIIPFWMRLYRNFDQQTRQCTWEVNTVQILRENEDFSL